MADNFGMKEIYDQPHYETSTNKERPIIKAETPKDSHSPGIIYCIVVLSLITLISLCVSIAAIVLLFTYQGNEITSAGVAGPKGEPGIKGDKGEQGEPGRQGKDANITGIIGTTYVRWGRMSCPTTAQLLYEGAAAGGYYSHKGGAANYLCLPLDPDFLQVDAGTGGSRDLIYGAEYETSSFPPLSNLKDHDVPCAVCRVTGRGTMLMIPAKTECPINWTSEYKGYLMSAYYDYAHQNEYVCVDENAEARVGTLANDNGALLYPVDARCGSLPCLPYVNGHELACVICTI